MLAGILTKLPDHLSERARVHRDGVIEKRQSFVLYWMRTAVRSDENAALDAAILVANQLKLPLLVYHAISQHYAFASDRHHTFMLQGARDVQTRLQELGISYAFHLATPNDHRPHLLTLVEQSSVLITEEMPVDPPRRFLNSVVKRTATTPIVTIDTACVVPMQLVQQAFTRAFRFGSATGALYDQSLTCPWQSLNPEVRPYEVSLLPFEPLDLQVNDLADLVAQCDIDHSVAPVVDTVGGSAAGYKRWSDFKVRGLSEYSRQRNDALLDGVSRMSAYLHYGMVSPMRLAREAAESNNPGGQKYLDELLIWRELAYSFCFHREDHDRWSAIPGWARETLQSHADDDRDVIYSWEELARAKTKDAFWNAAQLSLLRQGELHNNVRMTWGKAILNWTRSPQQALEFMIDLNHRFALDGRDPASYGGLLWCLGQFDRPFQPENRIVGTVRPRTIESHARRLNTDLYLQKVATPRFDPVPKVAVIGAGISGLFAARTLADHGLPVVVFDKGRGIGGRMSTRRVDGKPCFDHGAQYFTARDLRFRQYVESWLEQGVVARWPDAENDPSQELVIFKNGQRIEKSESADHERFVGIPAMNNVCKHLAKDLNVQTSTRIENVQRLKQSIQLTDDDGKMLGDFDRLIVSAPAGQTAELLADFPDLADPISQIQMQPCWAVMASFEEPWDVDWVGAFVHGSIVTWAARNNSKPRRPNDAEHLILHAEYQWTTDHWEDDPAVVAQQILDAFWQSSGVAKQTPKHLQAHRWKYAIPVAPPAARCYGNSDSTIVACGDWAGGPRVEGAFLSGMAAAGRILGTLQMRSQI